MAVRVIGFYVGGGGLGGGAPDFTLPPDVLDVLDTRYAALGGGGGGGGSTADIGAMLDYGGGGNQSVTADGWFTLVLPTKSTYFTSGHDSADLTFDGTAHTFTVHASGLYYVYAYMSYDSAPTTDVDLSFRIDVDEMHLIGPSLQRNLAATPWTSGDYPGLEISQIVHLVDGAVLTPQVYTGFAFTTGGGEQFRVVRVG